ncbi:Colicin I receptor precursor [Roseimaritima multifibrata]|uniref:Colicin I receptor n=2 Tax=Roseimaritima multifibrata TaxID=1930274 RepID=A0A517MCA4_9BACT|nr:Colicin I receptor precursor [Roseimaritima multifibrata]
MLLNGRILALATIVLAPVVLGFANLDTQVVFAQDFPQGPVDGNIAGQRSSPVADAVGGKLVDVDVLSRDTVGDSKPDETEDEDFDEDFDEDEDELDSLLDIADNDVGELANVNVRRNAAAPALQTEVTSVSRQKSTVGRSPAAIFVISSDMIRRSGARSVPDALRMAPGVEVARIDSSKWAVSIRGSNGRFANKLLVQIDGRTVYTPLFGGTFWDVQDLLLEDIERIEVSRGPGASVWGANAVNGVINIITKSASETLGTYVEAGAGTEDRGFVGARHGWQTESGVDMRVFGKWFDRDNGYVPGGAAHDEWEVSRGGFRADWKPDRDSTLTFQGDVYDGATGRENNYPAPPPIFSENFIEDADLAGWNTLLRYTQANGPDSEWSLQGYYDRTERGYPEKGFREDRDTVDVDFQHRFRWHDNHAVIWGASYRNTRDKLQNAPFFITFTPERRADDLFSYFVQDEITLLDDELFLTAGAKFIHSDYTPFEFQPTVRLLWTPNESQSIWCSYSRAVRLPTRVGDDVQLILQPRADLGGVFPIFTGNHDFVAEDLDAWEIGMRSQPTRRFSWDISAFYFDYDDLQSVQPGTPYFDPTIPAGFLPLNLSNDGEGRSYGFELTTNYELREWWRLYGCYSNLREEFNGDGTNADSSPNNQVYLQSSWDLEHNLSLDLIWRYVDNLPARQVPSYNTADARLGWTPSRNLEIALVGRNLLDPNHPEFASDSFTSNIATNVEREFYGMISLRY